MHSTTPPILHARYVHTNLVCADWRALARFYEDVFGCVPVLPERELSGDWLERGTAVPGAALRGVHLRLPGCGEHGPTLELFEYAQRLPHLAPAANRPGFGHLAFAVDDVAAARRAVLDAGGHPVGDIVSHDVPGAGVVTFAYVTDPEGNILELQRWAPSS